MDVRHLARIFIGVGLALSTATSCARSNSESTATLPHVSADPATSTTSTPSSPTKSLPIFVSKELSSSGQDPSILQPSTCQLQNGVVTATGSVVDGLVPEGYLRWGDVVELYGYTSPNDPLTGTNLQVLDLGQETPSHLDHANIHWTVTAPTTAVGTVAACFLAVQSTHAFMGAGNAGG